MNCYKATQLAGCLLLPLVLTACNGDDGNNGATGAQGPSGTAGSAGADGSPGSVALVTQTTLLAGSDECFDGGTRIDSGQDINRNAVLDNSEITASTYLCNAPAVNPDNAFVRIATFAVCEQTDSTCNTNIETAAAADINRDNTLPFLPARNSPPGSLPDIADGSPRQNRTRGL